MLRTAILIPVYNGLEYTKKCISQLTDIIPKTNPMVEYKIIVIDDDSQDGTYNYIKKHFPHVTLLKGDGNLWWSGGINLGARYAIEEMKMDYLLLWNNDIYPGEDYFTELSKIIETTDGNEIVGSKVYFSHKPQIIQLYGGYFNPKTGVKFSYAYNSEEKEKFNAELACDWIQGMGTLVPAEAVVKLKYWDEKNFPQYHGDSDFTYRAKKAGYSVKVVPQLKIWNNTENTGNNYPSNFKLLWQSFSSIRSDYNIKKDILFYKFHATSILSIWGLFIKYFWLFYGTFKRWILQRS